MAETTTTKQEREQEEQLERVLRVQRLVWAFRLGSFDGEGR